MAHGGAVAFVLLVGLYCTYMRDRQLLPTGAVLRCLQQLRVGTGSWELFPGLLPGWQIK